MSSALVGSSSSTNFGSSTMARAMAMRWRWPPENSCAIAVLRIGIEPDLLQRRADAPAPLVVGHAGALDQQALLDDLADRQARRQRAVGVLEDHLHLLAQRPHALGVEGRRCACRRRRSAPARRPAAAAPGRAWSCPSRTRRPRPASRRRAASAYRPSTALMWSTVRRSSPRLIGNQTLRSSVSSTTGALGDGLRRLALGLGRQQMARVGMLRPLEHVGASCPPRRSRPCS